MLKKFHGLISKIPRSASVESGRSFVDSTDSAHITTAASLPKLSSSCVRAASSDSVMPSYTFGQPGRLGDAAEDSATMAEERAKLMQTITELIDRNPELEEYHNQRHKTFWPVITNAELRDHRNVLMESVRSGKSPVTVIAERDEERRQKNRRLIEAIDQLVSANPVLKKYHTQQSTNDWPMVRGGMDVNFTNTGLQEYLGKLKEILRTSGVADQMKDHDLEPQSAQTAANIMTQLVSDAALGRLAKEAAEAQALGIDEDLNVHFDADDDKGRLSVAQKVEHFQIKIDEKRVRDGTQKTWDELKNQRSAAQGYPLAEDDTSTPRSTNSSLDRSYAFDSTDGQVQTAATRQCLSRALVVGSDAYAARSSEVGQEDSVTVYTVSTEQADPVLMGPSGPILAEHSEAGTTETRIGSLLNTESRECAAGYGPLRDKSPLSTASSKENTAQPYGKSDAVVEQATGPAQGLVHNQRAFVSNRDNTGAAGSLGSNDRDLTADQPRLPTGWKAAWIDESVAKQDTSLSQVLVRNELAAANHDDHTDVAGSSCSKERERLVNKPRLPIAWRTACSDSDEEAKWKSWDGALRIPSQLASKHADRTLKQADTLLDTDEDVDMEMKCALCKRKIANGHVTLMPLIFAPFAAMHYATNADAKDDVEWGFKPVCKSRGCKAKAAEVANTAVPSHASKRVTTILRHMSMDTTADPFVGGELITSNPRVMPALVHEQAYPQLVNVSISKWKELNGISEDEWADAHDAIHRAMDDYHEIAGMIHLCKTRSQRHSSGEQLSLWDQDQRPNRVRELAIEARINTQMYIAKCRQALKMNAIDTMAIVAKCTRRRTVVDSRLTHRCPTFHFCVLQPIVMTAATADDAAATVRCNLCTDVFLESSVAQHINGAEHVTNLEHVLQGQHGNRNLVTREHGCLVESSEWLKGLLMDLPEGIELDGQFYDSSEFVCKQCSDGGSRDYSCESLVAVATHLQMKKHREVAGKCDRNVKQKVDAESSTRTRMQLPIPKVFKDSRSPTEIVAEEKAEAMDLGSYLDEWEDKWIAPEIETDNFKSVMDLWTHVQHKLCHSTLYRCAKASRGHQADVKAVIFGSEAESEKRHLTLQYHTEAMYERKIIASKIQDKMNAIRENQEGTFNLLLPSLRDVKELYNMIQEAAQCGPCSHCGRDCKAEITLLQWCEGAMMCEQCKKAVPDANTQQCEPTPKMVHDIYEAMRRQEAERSAADGKRQGPIMLEDYAAMLSRCCLMKSIDAIRLLQKNGYEVVRGIVTKSGEPDPCDEWDGQYQVSYREMLNDLTTATDGKLRYRTIPQDPNSTYWTTTPPIIRSENYCQDKGGATLYAGSMQMIESLQRALEPVLSKEVVSDASWLIVEAECDYPQALGETWDAYAATGTYKGHGVHTEMDAFPALKSMVDTCRQFINARIASKGANNDEKQAPCFIAERGWRQYDTRTIEQKLVEKSAASFISLNFDDKKLAALLDFTTTLQLAHVLAKVKKLLERHREQKVASMKEYWDDSHRRGIQIEQIYSELSIEMIILDDAVAHINACPLIVDADVKFKDSLAEVQMVVEDIIPRTLSKASEVELINWFDHFNTEENTTARKFAIDAARLLRYNTSQLIGVDIKACAEENTAKRVELAKDDIMSITLMEIPPNEQAPNGQVRVEKIAEGSNAESLDIVVGDQVTSIAGHTNVMQTYRRATQSKRAGVATSRMAVTLVANEIEEVPKVMRQMTKMKALQAQGAEMANQIRQNEEPQEVTVDEMEKMIAKTPTLVQIPEDSPKGTGKRKTAGETPEIMAPQKTIRVGETVEPAVPPELARKANDADKPRKPRPPPVGPPPQESPSSLEMPEPLGEDDMTGLECEECKSSATQKLMLGKCMKYFCSDQKCMQTAKQRIENGGASQPSTQQKPEGRCKPDKHDAQHAPKQITEGSKVVENMPAKTREQFRLSAKATGQITKVSHDTIEVRWDGEVPGAVYTTVIKQEWVKVVEGPSQQNHNQAEPQVTAKVHSADVIWWNDVELENVRVKFSQICHAIDRAIHGNNQKEIAWRGLNNITEVHPMMVKEQGLIEARIAAYVQSNAYTDILGQLKQQYTECLNELQTVAMKVQGMMVTPKVQKEPAGSETKDIPRTETLQSTGQEVPRKTLCWICKAEVDDNNMVILDLDDCPHKVCYKSQCRDKATYQWIEIKHSEHAAACSKAKSALPRTLTVQHNWQDIAKWQYVHGQNAEWVSTFVVGHFEDAAHTVPDRYNKELDVIKRDHSELNCQEEKVRNGLQDALTRGEDNMRIFQIVQSKQAEHMDEEKRAMFYNYLGNILAYSGDENQYTAALRWIQNQAGDLKVQRSKRRADGQQNRDGSHRADPQQQVPQAAENKWDKADREWEVSRKKIEDLTGRPRFVAPNYDVAVCLPSYARSREMMHQRMRFKDLVDTFHLDHRVQDRFWNLRNNEQDITCRRFNPKKYILETKVTDNLEKVQVVDTGRMNKMAMDVMTRISTANRSINDRAYNPPAWGDDLEAAEGVLVNISDYPAHNAGRMNDKNRKTAECQVHQTYRQVRDLRTCNVTRDGIRTGRQVVCCAPGKRCVPVSYKNAQDQLKDMEYWCNLPDACPVCWLPQGQFCCCQDLCKNCLRSSFGDCQRKGCVMPGKAYPDEGAKVSRGHLKVWIEANKDILMDYQDRRRSRCDTGPSNSGGSAWCGRPGRTGGFLFGLGFFGVLARWVGAGNAIEPQKSTHAGTKSIRTSRRLCSLVVAWYNGVLWWNRECRFTKTDRNAAGCTNYHGLHNYHGHQVNRQDVASCCLHCYIVAGRTCNSCTEGIRFATGENKTAGERVSLFVQKFQNPRNCHCKQIFNKVHGPSFQFAFVSRMAACLSLAEKVQYEHDQQNNVDAGECCISKDTKNDQQNCLDGAECCNTKATKRRYNQLAQVHACPLNTVENSLDINIELVKVDWNCCVFWPWRMTRLTFRQDGVHQQNKCDTTANMQHWAKLKEGGAAYSRSVRVGYHQCVVVSKHGELALQHSYHGLHDQLIPRPLLQSKSLPRSQRYLKLGNWDWKNATRLGEAENPGPHVRGRAPVTTIVSYNVGSAMGNVKMAVDWLTKRGEYERHGSNHHVQLVQEYSNQTEANNREFAFWKDCARRAILTTSSVNANGSTTAGLVTTAKSNAAITIPTRKFPHNGATKSRMNFCMMHRVAQTGVIMANAYLYHSEGLSDNNWLILTEMGRYLTELGLPFIIAADWNMTPQMLAESGWLEAVDAVIRAPTDWTCKTSPQSQGTTIDYFVISRNLVPLVERVSIVDVVHGQHRPVEMVLRGNMRQLMQWTLVTPKAYPKLEYDKVAKGVTVKPYGWENDSQSTADQKLRELYKGIEYEMDQLAEAGEPEALLEASHGRADGFRLKKDQVQPKARNGDPKSCPQAERWRCMAKLLRDVYTLYSTGNVAKAVEAAFQVYTAAQVLGPSRMMVLDHARKMLCFFDAATVNESEALATWCDGMADSMQKHDCAERRRKYAAMLDKAALNNGARDAYAMVKLRPERKVANSQDNEGVDEQSHAEAQVKKWTEIWAATPNGPLPSMNHNLMTANVRDTSTAVLSNFQHTANTVKQATKKHKMNTALGVDNLSPKPITYLSNECHAAFAEFLNHIQRQLEWPEAIRAILMACIPKEDGDWRLVGLLPTPFRVWAASVVHIVSAWMDSLERQYVKFGVGKGSEQAAYRVALATEAKEDDMETLLAIGDLQKGFEMIRYHRLYRAAVKYRYPLDILVISLHMYTAQRRVKCGQAVSSGVWASHGIVAGCPIAMSLMLLNLLEPFDQFVDAMPIQLDELGLYVDDFIMLFVMRECDVSQRNKAIQAIRMLVGMLDENDSPVKKEKGRLMSTSNHLARQVAIETKDLGFEQVKEAKILGVDTSAGNVVRHKAMMVRAKKAKLKSKKVNRMFAIRHKRMNMVRAYTSGAMRYSAMVNGIPPRIVKQVRPQLHRSIAKNTGGSATVLLALQRNRWIDPWYDAATIAPIAWAKNVYAADKAINRMQSTAWMNHKAKVMTADDPWTEVRGPCTATYATIQKYGWTMPAWHTFRTNSGEILDLRETTPHVVQKKLREDVSNRLWNDAMFNAGFDYHEGTPWMPTMRRFAQKNTSESVAYRQLLQGSQWSMHRRFEAGMTDTDLCQVCKDHVGTEHHMGIGCNHVTRIQERYKYLEKSQIDRVRQGFGGHMFSARGIVAKKWLPLTFWLPRSNTTVTSHPRAMLQLFHGLVYTDGSGGSPWYAYELERVGWSAIQMRNGEAIPYMFAYGALDGEVQMVGRAELYAIVYVLENAVPPIVIKTDHLNHVKKFNRGERHCRSQYMSPYIDLWKRAWDQIEKLGGYGDKVKILYVPAHRKITANMCQSDIDDIIGNDQADRYAKMGRDIHAFDDTTFKAFEEIHQLQESYMAWLGHAITLRHAEGTTDVIQEKQRKKATQPGEEITPEILAADKLSKKRKRITWCHSFSKLARQLIMPPERPRPDIDHAEVMHRIIDRVQGSQPSKEIRLLRLKVMQQAARDRRAKPQRVSGPVRTRIPTPEETGGHELMLSDGTIWCNECGLYTRQRQSRQFGVECTQVVRPSREALRAGRHPIRGYKFRETRKVTAEIFAFAAHSPNCIRQQESRRIVFGYGSMSCSCSP